MGLPNVVDLIAADFVASSVPCPVLYGPDHIAEHTEPFRVVVVPTDDSYAPPQYVQQNAWPSGNMSDGQNPRTIMTRVEGARATIWARGTLVSRTFTANFLTNTFTSVAHGLSDGDPVQLTSSGALPAGTTILTDYVVAGATADTFQLTGVTLTSNGTGTHTVTDSPLVQQRRDYDALHSLINQFILSLHRSNPGNYRVSGGVTTETTRNVRTGYVYTLNFTVEVPIIDTPWPTETGVSQDTTVQLIRRDGSVIESIEITP